MLLEFEGTILFVSHDRYFIQKIASRVGEINQKVISYYEGDYDYYKLLKSREQKDIVIKKEKKVRIDKSNKKDLVVDYLKSLEEIEQLMNNIDQEMMKYGNDSIKLQELYEEKEALEKKYDEIYHLIDE